MVGVGAGVDVGATVAVGDGWAGAVDVGSGAADSVVVSSAVEAHPMATRPRHVARIIRRMGPRYDTGLAPRSRASRTIALVQHPGDPYIKASLREFGETIFAEMSALAVRTESPSTSARDSPTPTAPQEVARCGAATRSANGVNQYPPGCRVSRYPPRGHRPNTSRTGSGVSSSILTLGDPRSPPARPKPWRRRSSRSCEPGDEVIVVRAVLRLATPRGIATGRRCDATCRHPPAAHRRASGH